MSSRLLLAVLELTPTYRSTESHLDLVDCTGAYQNALVSSLL